ncbi:MAG TPA: hypothetical protein VGL71_12715, partial [Urbifossiella sp.]
MLAGLFGAWIGAECLRFEFIHPGDNLTNHLKNRPPSSSVTVFEIDGKEYVALFGPDRRYIFATPSSPPIYIFDS